MKKSYWETGVVYDQPTTDQLQKNAAETAKKAKSKGKKLHPVTVSGRAITNSFWGKSWCENLESYADYESRLDRGKRYLRTGAVVDLQIQKGRVSAKVQGRRKTPYKVEITISPIDERRCQKIMSKCSENISCLDELLKGDFPEELEEVFLGSDGLFPSPKQISFSCSCPDWAIMCKHVAAVLYGIGVRFDEDPLLFFELRGIDVDRFVDVTLANSVESMLANVNVESPRIIATDDWEKVFGLV
ncbi:MAG: SWIM zinc finger family protein [Lachnospiraceae bacterium]|nr:SWIM zinc finger family protein [Lachnospiraceae bacterium]